MSETLEYEDITQLPLDQKVGDDLIRVGLEEESPIVAHVRILLHTHNLEYIPDDVKNAALEHATKNKVELQESIDLWNRTTQKVEDRQILESLKRLSFRSTAISIVMSYGGDYDLNIKHRQESLRSSFSDHALQQIFEEM